MVDLLEIGRIGKAHGLKGEVVVTLTTDRLERVAPGTELHDGHGLLVVAESRPHQERHLVRFEGRTTREGAERLRGRVLSAAPIKDDDVLWVHELVGCRVRDQHGIDRGLVEAVLSNPAADLLTLDTGALIPLTFVLDIEDDVVLVDTPDGLFDLDN
ncbi:MAG: 16S rRNA processing protein RimM [Candidatus Poriferisodalaceae bacterium]|jgi:16S rRNA processing protein RimM